MGMLLLSFAALPFFTLVLYSVMLWPIHTYNADASRLNKTQLNCSARLAYNAWSVHNGV